MVMNLSDAVLQKLQRVLRVNMLLGLTVTIVSTYMIITGTYDNIESRQAGETMLSWVAIIGLMYTFGFWITCVFRNQFFKSTADQS